MRATNRWGDQHGTATTIVTHAVTAPLVYSEGFGLAEDAGIDWVKGHTVNDETPCDEGVHGYLNPLHAYVPNRLRGPIVYLPGIHSSGDVDWEQP